MSSDREAKTSAPSMESSILSEHAVGSLGSMHFLKAALPELSSDVTGSSHDEDSRKVFVGGLSGRTSQETLARYFASFGDVVNCQIMIDSYTGRSRGFGFVLFADHESQQRCLEHPLHRVEDHVVDVKHVVPRQRAAHMMTPGHHKHSPARARLTPDSASTASSLTSVDTDAMEPVSTSKLFVGGLPPSATQETLRVYFERFGEVTDAFVMVDKESRRSRGFGFVLFADERVAQMVKSVSGHVLNDKPVEVKAAQPREMHGDDYRHSFPRHHGPHHGHSHRGPTSRRGPGPSPAYLSPAHMPHQAPYSYYWAPGSVPAGYPSPYMSPIYAGAAVSGHPGAGGYYTYHPAMSPPHMSLEGSGPSHYNVPVTYVESAAPRASLAGREGSVTGAGIADTSE